MIFISTSAMETKNINELVVFSNKYHIPLEFSLVDYENEVVPLLQQLNEPFLFHNYFPRPSEDFTINLASLDSEIRRKSIDRVIATLKLSEQFSLPFYAVHAGFRVDIPFKQLGKKFDINKLVEYETAYETFKKSIQMILGETIGNKTTLLIENNLVTKENIAASGDNPLLMCEALEFARLFKDVPDRRLGILMDVGHLAVSAQALGFDRCKMLEQCAAWIQGYHLSENDGIMDRNVAVRDTSWFWPFLKKGLEYYTLEISPLDVSVLKEQMRMTEKFVGV